MSTDPTTGDSAGPAMLNPKSLGCILPAVLAAIVLGMAWYGIQSIIGNTGAWSLAAADFGLSSSGLADESQAPFTLEVQRLRVAYEDGTLDPQEVVKGVSGLLETRTIQLLVIDDLITRRIPGSELPTEEKEQVAADVRVVAHCVDGGQIPLASLLKILGPLAEVPEDGSAVAFGDDDLRALGERAAAALEVEGVVPPEEPRAVDADALLGRFRAHVDETLAAAAAAKD